MASGSKRHTSTTWSVYSCYVYYYYYYSYNWLLNPTYSLYTTNNNNNNNKNQNPPFSLDYTYIENNQTEDLFHYFQLTRRRKLPKIPSHRPLIWPSAVVMEINGTFFKPFGPKKLVLAWKVTSNTHTKSQMPCKIGPCVGAFGIHIGMMVMGKKWTFYLAKLQ